MRCGYRDPKPFSWSRELPAATRCSTCLSSCRCSEDHCCKAASTFGIISSSSTPQDKQTVKVENRQAVFASPCVGITILEAMMKTKNLNKCYRACLHTLTRARKGSGPVTISILISRLIEVSERQYTRTGMVGIGGTGIEITMKWWVIEWVNKHAC